MRNDEEDIVIDKVPRLEGTELKFCYYVCYLANGGQVIRNKVLEVYAGEEKDLPQIKIKKVDGMEFVEIWQHDMLNSIQKINRLSGVLKYENWLIYMTAYYPRLLDGKKEKEKNEY